MKTPADELREEAMRELREYIKNCNNMEDLWNLMEFLHDWLIEYVSFLRKNGMKTKLRKTWAELIDEGSSGYTRVT